MGVYDEYIQLGQGGTFRKSSDYGIQSGYPEVTPGDLKESGVDIPGRHGGLTPFNLYRKNAKVKVSVFVFDVIGETTQAEEKAEEWARLCRNADVVVLHSSIYGTDRPINIKTASVSVSRTRSHAFMVAAEWETEPFWLADGGKLTLTNGSQAIAEGCDVLLPVMTITGKGNCTFKRGSRSFTAAVTSTMTIDFKNLIVMQDGKNANSAVDGDLDEFFTPGTGTNTITSGFTVNLTEIGGYKFL